MPSSPDELLVAVGKKNVGIHSMEGVHYAIEVSRYVWSMTFSPDRKRLACGADGDVRVYDVDDGTLVLGPLKGILRGMRPRAVRVGR